MKKQTIMELLEEIVELTEKLEENCKEIRRDAFNFMGLKEENK